MVEIKNLSTYWLDKDTFCFAFDGGIDEDGKLYAFRNMQSKLFHEKYGYFSDNEKRNAKRVGNDI